MGQIFNTDAGNEAKLMEAAEAAEGLKVVDTGDGNWPKAIEDPDGNKVYIEGSSFLVWGTTKVDKIMRGLSSRGVFVTDIE